MGIWEAPEFVNELKRLNPQQAENIKLAPHGVNKVVYTGDPSTLISPESFVYDKENGMFTNWAISDGLNCAFWQEFTVSAG